MLSPNESEVVRDRLLNELDALQTADDAASWAHRSLPAKNTLTSVDAQLVEASFGTRIAAFGDKVVDDRLATTVRGADGAHPAPLKPEDGVETGQSSLDAQPPGATNDFRARRRRVAAKTIRLRDKEHRRFVATQPCLVCGRAPSDPHHLRFAQPRALGRKVSDEFTVPVCRLHHREIHRHGDEIAWWSGVKIDPVPVALGLWQHTRPTGGAFSPDGHREADAAIRPECP